MCSDRDAYFKKAVEQAQRDALTKAADPDAHAAQVDRTGAWPFKLTRDDRALLIALRIARR